jgi:hypothetical protein
MAEASNGGMQLHLHAPHAFGHGHDRIVALVAAAAVAVAVGVGGGRVIGGGPDGGTATSSSRTSTLTEAPSPTAARAPTGLAPVAPGATTHPERTTAPTGSAPTDPATASVVAAAAAQAVVVDVPVGMHLTEAWLVGASGVAVPASSVGPEGIRFDGLAAGTYTVAYQAETGTSDAGNGAMISAAQAGSAGTVDVEDGGSIVLAVRPG